MTVIHTICTQCCTSLEMGPKDLHLVTHDRGERDFYEFICPACVGLIRKPADRYVIRALRLGKVPETRLELPEEALDPKRDWTLPITKDDVLDFVLALRASDFPAMDLR